MIHRSFKYLALTTFFIGLSGCAMAPPVNGYTQYYQANELTPEVIMANRAAPPPATPTVDHVNIKNYEKTAKDWFRKGYSLIGKSEFSNSTAVPEQLAIDQARILKADVVVIIDPEYQGTVTTTSAVSKPTSSTSVTSLSAGKLNGSATTSTYSTTTDYIPVTHQKIAFGALYFVKWHIILGAATIELDEAERQARQTNYGVKITMVTDDSPAFKADLLIGDIVEKADGQRVSNPTHLSNILEAKKGQVISFTFNRKGKVFEKSIQLNN